MPPEDKPQPSPAETEKAARWIEAQLAKVDCRLQADPGRVTLRRLNRAEYNNTIRDLVGVDFQPADDFPVGRRRLRLRQHRRRADPLADPDGEVPRRGRGDRRPGDRRRQAADAPRSRTSSSTTDAVPSRRGLRAERRAASQQGRGRPRVRLRRTTASTSSASRPSASRPGRSRSRWRSVVDGKDVHRRSMSRPRTIRRPTRPGSATETGTHRLGVAFLNDYLDEKERDPKKRDRNLIVRTDFWEVDGPLRTTTAACPSRTSGSCSGRRAATATSRRSARSSNVSPAGPSAGRRRPTSRPPGEARRAGRAGAASGSRRGIQLAVQAVLVSPHFLFRVELDPTDAAGRPHPIDDFELASRLSYFLWSSMPDDELFDAGRERASCSEPATLEAQVRRMLKDPKVAGAGRELRRPVAPAPQPRRRRRPTRARSPTFDEPLRDGDDPARPSCSSRRSSARTAASSTSSTPTSPSSTSGWPSTTASRASTGDEFRRVTLAGRPPRRAADAGEHPDGHLEPDADLAGEARASGSWSRSSARRRPPPPPDVPELTRTKDVSSRARSGSGWSSTGPTRLRRLPRAGWTRSASASRTSTPSAPGATKDGDVPDRRLGRRCPTGRSFNGPAELKAILQGQDRTSSPAA